MKRNFLSGVLMTLVLVGILSGCSRGANDSAKGGNLDIQNDINIAEEVKQSIENNLSANVVDLLYDGMDGLTVVASNGKIMITARAGIDFYIPLIANELCPIVLEDATKNDYELDIVIQKYGTGEDTSVSWHSTDGETGTFLDTTKNVVKSKSTIDDMYEYYDEQITEWNDILFDNDK